MNIAFNSFQKAYKLSAFKSLNTAALFINIYCIKRLMSAVDIKTREERYPRASITLLALSEGAVAAKIFDQKSARRSDPAIN